MYTYVLAMYWLSFSIFKYSNKYALTENVSAYPCQNYLCKIVVLCISMSTCWWQSTTTYIICGHTNVLTYFTYVEHLQSMHIYLNIFNMLKANTYVTYYIHYGLPCRCIFCVYPFRCIQRTMAEPILDGNIADMNINCLRLTPVIALVTKNMQPLQMINTYRVDNGNMTSSIWDDLLVYLFLRFWIWTQICIVTCNPAGKSIWNTGRWSDHSSKWHEPYII